jgi:single-strand DNA-binding protein
MASYNRIVLVGNLTRDPEHRPLPSGQAVCRLGLATNRQFKNRQTGSMVQEVCYIDVDVWGAQAESCRQYLQKGRLVLIEGRLKLDTWQDQSGGNRSKHTVVADRVVFLNSGANATATEGMAELEEEPAPTSLRGGELTLNPNNRVEKDLLDQLERAEKKVKAAKTVKDKKSDDQMAADPFGDGGEIDFKDHPPFEDELPF